MSLTFLHFATFAEVTGLRHAITTRAGGESVGPYRSLNLGAHVGDDHAVVAANRRRLASVAGFEPERLVTAQQVHGLKVAQVGEIDAGRGALDWEGAFPDTDGLITTASDLPVMVLVADCAPLLLVDPGRQVLAVVHAGWRGAVGGMVPSTVEALRTMGSNPGALLVGIGPCLCTECFEVGPEVIAAAAPIASQSIQIAGMGQRAHLDLRLLLRRQLEGCGVPPEQVEVMSPCPRCDTDTFFSHRGENGITGRFGLVAWWASSGA